MSLATRYDRGEPHETVSGDEFIRVRFATGPRAKAFVDQLGPPLATSEHSHLKIR